MTTINNSTGVGSDDDDYARDVREAYLDACERTAEDLRAMDAEDQLRDDYDYHEALHPIGSACLFCDSAARVCFESMLVHLSHISPDANDLSDDSVLPILTKSAALQATAGRRRLRTLEAVGDAALSAVISIIVDSYGWDVSIYQQARSTCTSNHNLASLFNASVLRRYVLYPGDVSTALGTSGAKTLEAILGFVCIRMGLTGVFWLTLNLGILSLYTFPDGVTASTMSSSASRVGTLNSFSSFDV